MNENSQNKPPALDVEGVLSSLRMIEMALKGPAPDTVAPEQSFSLPLSEVLKLIPQKHLEELPADLDTAEPITVTLDSLFAQLTRGKVSMSVSELVYFIPSHLVKPAAYEDKTPVNLPLAFVVKSIGTSSLRKRTTQNARIYDIGSLDDPFTRPQVKRSVEEVEADVTGETKGPAPVVVEPAAPPVPPPLPPVPVSAPEERPAPEPATAPVNEVAETAVVEQPVPTVEPVAPPAPQSLPAPPPLPVPVPAVAAVQAPVVPVPVPARTGPPPPEMEWPELPGAVNVNAASLDELMTLAGMTRPLAARIITYRQEKGPFRSIFDIGEVPRLGRKVFRQMTGIAWTSRREHRRERLADLLGVPVEHVADLRVLAAGMAASSGFTGCILSDREGLLLAESGAGQQAEALSAVIPKTVRQIMENMQLMTVDQLESVSIGIKGVLYTTVAHPGVVVTAIHEENKITKAQLALVRKVAVELAWLFSHRAYAGPPA